VYALSKAIGASRIESPKKLPNDLPLGYLLRDSIRPLAGHAGSMYDVTVLLWGIE